MKSNETKKPRRMSSMKRQRTHSQEEFPKAAILQPAETKAKIFESVALYPLQRGLRGRMVVQAYQPAQTVGEEVTLVVPTKKGTFILEDIKESEWVVELPDDRVVRMSNEEFKESFKPFSGSKGTPYWLSDFLKKQVLEQDPSAKEI
jgi:hypothetical protein